MSNNGRTLIAAVPAKIAIPGLIAILVFIISLLPLLSRSQNYATRHYTVKDGLPGNSVRCVFKDSRGLLWIGTDAGLCTYDGSKFQAIGNMDGFRLSSIWAITEDKDGLIWIGSFGQGLCSFDRKKFVYYTAADNKIKSDWIRTLYYSHRFQCLMIGSESGIDVFKDGVFITPVIQPALNNKLVVTDFTETQDYILVNVYGAMDFRYFPHRSILIQRNETDYDDYPPHSSSSLITQKNDTILGYARAGLMVKKKEGEKATIFKDFGQVFGIIEDKRSRIWIAAWSIGMIEPGGLYMYDEQGIHRMNEKLGIFSNECWNVFYDNEQHILWLGTNDNGLFMINEQYFVNRPVSSFSSSSFIIKDVHCSQRGDIWMASDSNLIRIYPDGKIHEIDNGEIFNSYLWSMRPADLNKVKKDPALMAMAIRQSRGFKAIDEDDSGNIIVSFEGGILRLNQDNSFKLHPFAHGCQFVLLPGDTIVYGQWLEANMTSDPWNNKASSKLNNMFTGDFPKGNIGQIRIQGSTAWYCSWTSGIFKSTGTHFERFGLESGIPNYVNDICFVDEKKQVIGANDGSIYLTLYKNGKLIVLNSMHLNTEIGTSINWLQFDKEKDLWIGTNKGLVCLDFQSWVNQDLANLHFWNHKEGYLAAGSQDAFIDKNGTLWTGFEEGLVSVNATALKKPHGNQLRVMLTDMEIGGVSIKSDSTMASLYNKFYTVDSLHVIQLSSQDRDLSFYFDVYNYINPEKDEYRYMLAGYDKDWSAWKPNKKIMYTNLPAGQYVLRVESRNLSSGSVASAYVFSFRIPPRWYASLHFLIAVVFLLILLIWLFTQWRVKLAKKEQKEASSINLRLIEFELRTLQNQINPHFMFNSLNSLQNFILDNRTDEALAFLGDFAHMLRKTFEFSTRKQVGLAEYLALLDSYLKMEKLRFGDKIEYKIRVQEGLEPQSLLIIPLVLQPFVENAVKHGIHHKEGLGSIDIFIHHPEDKILECIVEDNGIGREASAKLRKFVKRDTNSLGIAITNERIKLLNEDQQQTLYGVTIIDLKDSQDKPSGTRVIVRLPYWSV